jgi:hypothetical protein
MLSLIVAVWLLAALAVCLAEEVEANRTARPTPRDRLYLRV